MNPTDCSCQIKKLESDGIELNLALNIFLGQAMTKVNLDEHHQSKLSYESNPSFNFRIDSFYIMVVLFL